MNRFTKHVIGLVLMLTTGLCAGALKPLSEEVKGAVGVVRDSGTWRVPVITWGGDIVTIHANGDATTTKPGSAFGQKGLSVQLYREDVFARQVDAYRKGETAFLRGTVGMILSASEVLGADPRTVPVVIHQLSWSTGGDALVVGSDVRSVADLKGKRIALQAYGPHMDYLIKVLRDASLGAKEVTLVWTSDLTGTDNSPAAFLQSGKADAAFVITPDALSLTSGGNVGTGAEQSVKGARILMSTKTADKVIGDVYAVRKDFYDANQSRIQAFVAGLIEAQAETTQIIRAAKGEPYAVLTKSAAKVLLDSEEAVADVVGLFGDCTLVGAKGNQDFLTSQSFPRRLSAISKESGEGLMGMGVVGSVPTLAVGDISFGQIAAGVGVVEVSKPKFDEAQVAKLVSQRQQQGAQAGTLFSFDVYFKPNQNTFAADFYGDSFDRVIDLASTYGGALITVEGNADPMGYLKAKKADQPALVLGQIKQSAKNLSLSRAQQVRDAIILFANTKGVALDPSQFAVVGNGISAPATGICGSDPCAPKTEQEWLSNMRVEFKIIQVEAESDVFSPL